MRALYTVKYAYSYLDTEHLTACTHALIERAYDVSCIHAADEIERAPASDALCAQDEQESSRVHFERVEAEKLGLQRALHECQSASTECSHALDWERRECQVRFDSPFCSESPIAATHYYN